MPPPSRPLVIAPVAYRITPLPISRAAASASAQGLAALLELAVDAPPALAADADLAMDAACQRRLADALADEVP